MKTVDGDPECLAVGYLRTSSAANVEGDSSDRQRAAINAYAEREGIEIVAEFSDDAVSGADSLSDRPGFRALMKALGKTGARKILVESASRFARDLIIAETGWRFLRSRGVELVAADSPDRFVADTPTAILIRQILGAVSEFEKTALVLKLRDARRRLGRLGGKPRPPVAAVARARELNGSLKSIAKQMADEGFVSSVGKAYAPSVIRTMRAVGGQCEKS
jgi:DNA invertase Pin-like site-specific DNA recombinase